ncbi:MAG: HD domain-containing protein [Bacilli bacterium]|nr:HD domain-containing protein [Bacilli bacterium]
MNSAILEFLNYTNNYLEYGNKIDLKIKHTFRVMRLSETLAIELNLSEEEINIAKIIGLLHDIGRFEQWMKYETFEDNLSIDHADFGVKVLKKDNYIRKFNKDDKYDDIILKSVKYHNKYLLPKNLTKKEKLFSNIIRDADKIDILYLFTKGVLSIDVDKEFSEDVYKALINRKNVDRKSLINKTDKLSISLSFIFDINYKASIEYLRDKKYYDMIIDIYKKQSKSKIFKEQLEEIRKTINDYMEEMLEC